MLSKSLILGAKLLSKSKGLEISELSNAIKNFKLPPNLNINSNAINFDKVVLESKIGNKYIFSLDFTCQFFLRFFHVRRFSIYFNNIF